MALGHSATAIALVLIALASSAFAAHFNYSHGGQDWEGLCQTGQTQSPINVVRHWAKSDNGLSLSVSYEASESFTVSNSGHGVEVEPQHGTKNVLTFGKESYKLKQVHAHSLSEHTFDGYLTPLELHFVHASEIDPKKLLVLGIPLRYDPNNEDNKFLATWLPHIPLEANTSVEVHAPLDLLAQVVPRRKELRGHWARTKTQLYTYQGSLTVPPCTEGVTWLLVDPEQGPTLSRNQLLQFQDFTSGTFHGVPTSNRPPQPIRERLVTAFHAYL